MLHECHDKRTTKIKRFRVFVQSYFTWLNMHTCAFLAAPPPSLFWWWVLQLLLPHLSSHLKPASPRKYTALLVHHHSVRNKGVLLVLQIITLVLQSDSSRVFVTDSSSSRILIHQNERPCSLTDRFIKFLAFLAFPIFNVLSHPRGCGRSEEDPWRTGDHRRK